jgi:hypothetical protein
MGKMDETLEKLRDRSEGHREGKKMVGKRLSRAQEANEELHRYYHLLTADTTTRFVKVRPFKPAPPPRARSMTTAHTPKTYTPPSCVAVAAG